MMSLLNSIAAQTPQEKLHDALHHQLLWSHPAYLWRPRCNNGKNAFLLSGWLLHLESAGLLSPHSIFHGTGDKNRPCTCLILGFFLLSSVFTSGLCWQPPVTDGSQSEVEVKPVPRPRSKLKPKADCNSSNNSTVDSIHKTSNTTNTEVSNSNRCQKTLALYIPANYRYVKYPISNSAIHVISRSDICRMRNSCLRWHFNICKHVTTGISIWELDELIRASLWKTSSYLSE